MMLKDGGRPRSRQSLRGICLQTLVVGSILVWPASPRAIAGVPEAADGGQGGAGSNTDKKITYKVADWDQNRFVIGDPHKFQKPAEINMLEVLMKIPAYQEIVREKLTSKDSRYYFLMREATEQLIKATEIVTRKTGHDIVADTGAIQAEGGEMTNLTQLVIEALTKK